MNKKINFEALLIRKLNSQRVKDYNTNFTQTKLRKWLKEIIQEYNVFYDFSKTNQFLYRLKHKWKTEKKVIDFNEKNWIFIFGKYETLKLENIIYEFPSLLIEKMEEEINYINSIKDEKLIKKHLEENIIFHKK